MGDLLDLHEHGDQTATRHIRPYTVEVPYGVAGVNRGRLLALREKASERALINAGIYVVSSEAVAGAHPERVSNHGSLREPPGRRQSGPGAPARGRVARRWPPRSVAVGARGALGRELLRGRKRAAEALVLLTVAAGRRRIRLDVDPVYIAVVYAAVFARSPIFTPRYFLPV